MCCSFFYDTPVFQDVFDARFFLQVGLKIGKLNFRLQLSTSASSYKLPDYFRERIVLA